jgi:murein DD-endopeptidase MepM/ murein hydrolase activator NlpD
MLHAGVASLAFLICLSTIGVAGFFRDSVLAKDNSEFAAPVAATVLTVPAEPKTIDYSRPQDSSDNFALNSGGPMSDMQISEAEVDDAESDRVRDQLKDVVGSLNPSSLPSMWAHLGKINNEFGFRRNPFGGRSYEFHAGMDIDGERGDNVIAPGNGTVIKAGWTGGYGNLIEIDHGNGLTTRYGHLLKLEVSVGDPITRGQLIGLLGSTGRSTGPHLHYELRINDKPINPRLLLPPEPTEIKQDK